MRTRRTWLANRTEAAGPQIFGAAARAFGGEHLDGVFGDAEQGGDFLLGKAFDFAEEEHFAAAGGQGVDGFGEESELLSTTDGFDDIGSIHQDGRAGVFRYGHEIGAGFARDKIAHGIARDGEKEGLGRADFGRATGADQAGEGLLHEVVDILVGGQRLAQVGAQRSLVGLHFFGKPPRLIGAVERFHGGGIHRRGRG